MLLKRRDAQNSIGSSYFKGLRVWMLGFQLPEAGVSVDSVSNSWATFSKSGS